MTQSIVVIDPTVPDGDTGASLASKLNDWRSSFISSHKGSSRPSYVLAGNFWVDDATTPWVLKFYDGSQDISLFTLNASTHAYALASLNAAVQTFLAATSVQAMLNALRQGVVNLDDEATVTIDASLGKTFRITAAGNRTFEVINPTDAQEIIIEHTASGADRTPVFPTGAGGFDMGSESPLTATVSGKTDEIGWKYHAAANRWRCLGPRKGFL